MTALRHPNVVLFMAASTKVGEMCIVMEFMALGSLFDVPAHSTFALFRLSYILRTSQQLLHNELIPELPYALKIKMAYHAAKGMHFLHSSGTTSRV
jgi:serine/threonine protein kinase